MAEKGPVPGIGPQELRNHHNRVLGLTGLKPFNFFVLINQRFYCVEIEAWSAG
jgi:hypothetical protein